MKKKNKIASASFDLIWSWWIRQIHSRKHVNQIFFVRTYLKNKSPGYWIYMTWRFVHGCELIFFAIRPNATPLSTPTHVKMVSKFRWTNPLLFTGIVWNRFFSYIINVGYFFYPVYECTCVRKEIDLTKLQALNNKLEKKRSLFASPACKLFVELKAKITMNNKTVAENVGELWTRWLMLIWCPVSSNLSFSVVVGAIPKIKCLDMKKEKNK